MIQTNGGRYLKGKSVHNARIERLWRDCRLFCFDFFMALFAEMESEDILHADNNLHLAALQYVYMPRINRALDNFTQAHNNAPSRSLNNKTPSQAFILSQFQYTPDVPNDLPPIENEHVAVTLNILNLEPAQIERLKTELNISVPDPLIQTPDHGITMFQATLQIITDFVNQV